MPGIVTHFTILDQTLSGLEAPGTSAAQKEIAQIMRGNAAYAYLGAIGPALADFIPSDPALPGEMLIPGQTATTQYFQIWQTIFAIMGGDGTANNPGLLSILNDIQSSYSELLSAVQGTNVVALTQWSQQGGQDRMTKAAASLGDLVATVQTNTVINIGQRIVSMEPIVNLLASPTPAPPESWTAREFLFWKKTGDFANALLDKARDSGDSRFLAYAYGYISSYVGFVTGSPFLNSIIGGTYRSDWWRYRWINNFVDAWVYGFFQTGATMNGDVPTPSYDNWKGLCNANLQNKIVIGNIDPKACMIQVSGNQPFPQVLPADFDDFWYSAFDQVFGPRDPNSVFKNGSTNAAYIMTWMVLWFQTSGDIVGCPIPFQKPPDGAGDPPAWVSDILNQPPLQQFEQDVDQGKVESGLLLALLDIIFLGDPVLATVGGGVAYQAVDWNQLTIDVYWMGQYIDNAITALHDIMVIGCLQHPYPDKLQGGDSITLPVLNAPFTFDSAIANCKSKRPELFPPIPWDGSLVLPPNHPSLWLDPPNRMIEEAATRPYNIAGAYPDFFISDQVNNPLATGIVTNKLSAQFGNAVENILQILSDPKQDLPNWNLDADRGLAFPTWQFTTGYSNPVVIKPEP